MNSLPAPYYQDDNAVIYHADCREILPLLPKVDLVLTDPPYGLNSWTSTGGNSITAEQAAEISKWDSQRPDGQLITQICELGNEAIVWGGNYFADVLGPSRAPIVWDKKQRGMHFADGEMAWTNFKWGALRIFEYAIVGGETFGAKMHPTQKPIPVINFCIQQAKKSATILDPFMGSGTTLVSAKQLGRKAIGIEIEKKYCDVAVKRLAQEVLPL